MDNIEEVLQEFIASMEDKKNEFVEKYKLDAFGVFSLMSNTALNTLISCCSTFNTQLDAINFASKINGAIMAAIFEQLSQNFKNKEN